MRLNAQEEYGLRCLVAIAGKYPHETMSIAELSAIEGLSEPHIARILSVLRNAGVLKASRGQTGGYTLTVPPDEISLTQIMEALGDRLYGPDFCSRFAGTHDECAHIGKQCAVGGVWARLQEALDAVLEQMTLQDVLDRRYPEVRTLIENRRAVLSPVPMEAS